MSAAQKRSIAVELAQHFVGTPYIWGGDDPINGFDCSGLMVEILQSVGALDVGIDLTADDLSKTYPKMEAPKPGDLIFWDWNLDGKIDHVEMVHSVLDDGTVLTIGASGGTAATTTPQEAMQQNAYIKMRPAREDHAKICDPY